METEKSLAAIENLITDYYYVRDNILLDDVSVAQSLQQHLTKMLILSCASYYENTLTKTIAIYAQKHKKKYKQAPHGFEYVESYPFFKMFNFGRDKIKKPKEFLSPLSFLGTAFKGEIIFEITSDEEKESNMEAFQIICSMRNSLAHNDLITYVDTSGKSFEDIKNLHKKAITFLEYLQDKII